jgi:hypothetical protein
MDDPRIARRRGRWRRLAARGEVGLRGMLRREAIRIVRSGHIAHATATPHNGKFPYPRYVTHVDLVLLAFVTCSVPTALKLGSPEYLTADLTPESLWI